LTGDHAGLVDLPLLHIGGGHSQLHDRAGLEVPRVLGGERGIEDPFIDDAGREALNFGISIAIYGSVLLVAALMLVGIPC
jgi:uncharacterized Tic20 family protein